MSKLPMADFKTMDRLLHRLGFSAVPRKGGMSFIVIPMVEQPHYPTVTSPDLKKG